VDGTSGKVRRAPDDGDPAGADGKFAGVRRLAALSVPEIVQPVDELPIGQRLAFPKFQRPREYSWQYPLPLAVKALVDDLRKRDVVVPRDEGQRDKGHARDHGGDANPAAPPDRGDAVECLKISRHGERPVGALSGPLVRWPNPCLSEIERQPASVDRRATDRTG
jgi:hypothetical protein